MQAAAHGHSGCVKRLPMREARCTRAAVTVTERHPLPAPHLCLPLGLLERLVLGHQQGLHIGLLACGRAAQHACGGGGGGGR